MESYKADELRIKSFTSTLVVGSSNSGKSFFCLDVALKRNTVFSEPHEKTIYFFRYRQDIFDIARKDDESILFISSKSELEDELESSDSTLLVCDDFLTGVQDPSNNKFVTRIFLERCHHESISCLYQSQLLYPKFGRSWTLNANHIVLFKNFHESQVTYFFRNFGSQASLLHEAYKQCTSEKYGHLVISLHPSTPENLRYRSSFGIQEGTRFFRQSS